MTDSRGTTPFRLTRLLAVLLAVLLMAAACGDDTDADTSPGEDAPDDTAAPDEDDTEDADEDSDDSEPPADDEPLTASFRGVTETTITIGVSLLDFDALVESNLSPAGWGDQQAAWEALIADLNDKGGINGRQVEAVYEFYNPIDPEDATRACIALAEDQEVFAVLGGFVGPLAGTVDPCITGQNDTILVGGDQNAEELEQSTAPWYQPGQSADASTEILLNLLDETGGLEGASVFVMGGQADEVSHDPVIQALEDRGIEVVGDALVVAPDGDTAAQDNELGIITERIVDSGATAVFIHGIPSSSVRGLAAAGLIEELDVWSNNPAGLNNLGSTISDKSVADGIVTATGPDDTTIWEDPLYQSQCSEVAAAALPEADIRPPSDYGEDDENWFNGIRYGCRNIDLFAQIATAAGNELTHESFVAGAESLSDFTMPGSAAASLSADKLFAEDTFALAEYDSTAGDGMAMPVGELIDVYP